MHDSSICPMSGGEASSADRSYGAVLAGHFKVLVSAHAQV